MKCNRGMSLLEVVIAAAVLIIMVALLMTVFFGMSTGTDDATRTTQMGGQGRLTLDRLRDQIATARFGFTVDPDGSLSAATPVVSGDELYGGMQNNHCMLRMQAPLQMGANGLQDWGCIQPPNTQVVGGYYEVSFVGDTIFYETGSSTLTPDGISLPSTGVTEITLDRDLNLDGDKTDAFVRGRIIQRAYSPTAALLATTLIDDFVLLRARLASGALVSPASLDGAINSDAEATGSPLDYSAVDPLFRILNSLDGEVANTAISTAARKIRVTLYHGQLDRNERTMLRVRNQEDVRLDNPQ